MYTSHCSRSSAVIFIGLSCLSEVTHLYCLLSGRLAARWDHDGRRLVVTETVVSEVVSGDMVVGLGVGGAKINFFWYDLAGAGVEVG